MALSLAFTAWVLLVVSQVGGRPWPPIGLVTCAVVAVMVGGISAARRPLAIPILVASSPIVLSLLNRQPLIGDGPLGYANASGAFFVVAAAAGLVAGASATHRLVRRAAYGTAAAWIAIPWISGARTAALIAVLLAVVVLVRHSVVTKRIVLLAGTGLVTAGIVLTLVLGTGYEPGGRAGTTDRLVDATLGELRVVLWSEAAELVREDPLWGVGPGMFPQTSQTARVRDDARWAHNDFLQTAAETGVVGGLLLVGLVAWAFARLNRPGTDGRSIFAAVALGGVAVNATIDYVWHFPEVAVALALLVGATSVDPDRHGMQSRRVLSAPSRIGVLATLGLWVVLLLPIGAINPAYTVPNGVARLSATGAVAFTGAGGVIRSDRPPVSLHEQIVENQALTIEMWAATHDVDQSGPARLVSASEGTINRNVTVGQDGDRLVFRLRTTETDWNATDPHLSIEGVFASTDLQHIVVATDVDVTRVFVNGALRTEWNGPGGALDNWVYRYPLLLGNEQEGDRPWLGELHLVTIYGTALSSDQVQARYAGGPPTAPQGSAEGDVPIADYRFDEPGGSVVIDRSPTALGGDLEMPARFAAPSPGFVTVMLDLDHSPAARLATHAVVFAAWAIPVGRATRRHHSALATTLLIGSGGFAILLAASVARYMTGRAPSLVDLAGALIGCAVGCLLPALPRSAMPTSRHDG